MEKLEQNETTLSLTILDKNAFVRYLSKYSVGIESPTCVRCFVSNTNDTVVSIFVGDSDKSATCIMDRLVFLDSSGVMTVPANVTFNVLVEYGDTISKTLSNGLSELIKLKIIDNIDLWVSGVITEDMFTDLGFSIKAEDSIRTIPELCDQNNMVTVKPGVALLIYNGEVLIDTTKCEDNYASPALRDVIVLEHKTSLVGK